MLHIASRGKLFQYAIVLGKNEWLYDRVLSLGMHRTDLPEDRVSYLETQSATSANSVMPRTIFL